MFGRPVAGGPIECLPRLDDLVKAAADLLHRGVLIADMSIDDIDIVKLESLQTHDHSFLYVLPVGGKCRIYIGIYACQYFSSDYDVLSLDAKFFENFSKFDFGLASPVDLSSIEIVDSALDAVLYDLLILMILRLRVDGRSHRNDRELES